MWTRRYALRVAPLFLLNLYIAGCSCQDDKQPARQALKSANASSAEAIKSTPTPATEQKASKEDGGSEGIPKPPILEGMCNCKDGEYCAQSVKPAKKGYPDYEHRCLAVSDDCQSCACLDVDPCWEPLTCQALTVETKKIFCDYAKRKK